MSNNFATESVQVYCADYSPTIEKLLMDFPNIKAGDVIVHTLEGVAINTFRVERSHTQQFGFVLVQGRIHLAPEELSLRKIREFCYTLIIAAVSVFQIILVYHSLTLDKVVG